MATYWATIDRLAMAGTADDDRGRRHDLFPVAISRAEGEALARWVAAERAAITIEIGLGYGISALHVLAGALAHSGPGVEVRHLAIDPFQGARFADLGRRHLAEAGVAKLVEVIEHESQVVLPRLIEEGRAATFDLAFVDGNHRFDRVFLDLVYLGRLLRPGSVIFLDDYQLPAIARAAEFFISNRSWMLEELSPPDAEHRWVVLRIAAVADDRGYADFIDFRPA